MKTLAICDTGFSSEILNLKNIYKYKDFGSKSKEHGTLVAKTIISVNPNCNLILAGIDTDSAESVLKALEWIFKMNPYILNISWVTKDKDKRIIDALKNISNYGTKVFCAKNDIFKYPWSEFIGIDSSIEKDSVPNIAAKGSSISCAIYSAKQFGETEKNNVFFSDKVSNQLNLQL